MAGLKYLKISAKNESFHDGRLSPIVSVYTPYSFCSLNFHLINYHVPFLNVQRHPKIFSVQKN